MKIKVLPANIANMIAAGEVVQNPASVVKELMENALDAGASCVSVIISDAGKTLIRVIDDGCGMSEQDAVTCFERHATSKIESASDLESISSFGFRGEALASIAAVAEVTLKTRRKDDEIGIQVDYANSQLQGTSPVATPSGADFSVRNLFYNVPARRKFLKSDPAEFRKIIAEFTRIAMTCPDKTLRLSHNGKDIFNVRPVKDLRVRIMDLLGKDIVKEIVEAGAQTSVVNISGYVGKPECARKTAGNQYFFVNGRFFKSPYLHKAVMKGYEGLVPQGSIPTYFLMLDVDPSSIDVNIHPSKAEVKFENEDVIFQIVFACVKEALGKNSFVPSIDFDLEGAPEIPVFNPSEDVRIQSLDRFDAQYNPFDNDGFDNEADFSGMSSPGNAHGEGFSTCGDTGGDGFSTPYLSPRQDYGKLFDGNDLDARYRVLTLGTSHILAKGKDGLIAVNVIRARERIFFTRMIQSVAMGEIVTQRMLFPVTAELGAHAVSLVEQYRDLLSEIGFEIAPFSNTSIALYGLPSGYSPDKKDVMNMLAELICSLDESAGEIRSNMISNLAVRLSHIAALGGRDSLTEEQAESLVVQLMDCEDSSYSPYSHKKCYVRLEAEDLDKFLG